MVACTDCGKEFDSRMSMEQHYAAKHAKQKPVSPYSKKSKKKPIIAALLLIIVLGSGYFMFFNSSGEKPVIEQADVADVNLDEVPKGPIHWHPELTVIIKGEVQNIPRNLGLGSVHKPVHTHDDVPVLHYENSRPTAETVTLGYFFSDVWRKTFNSQCIFSYCSGAEGNLSMTVNGKPNFQFDNYIPKDGDKIVIMFG